MPIFSCLSIIRAAYDHIPNFIIDSIGIKTKYGAMAVTVTPIVIFASIYVALAYTSRAWRKPETIQRVLPRSVSLGVLHGGQLAWQKLVDYHHVRADEVSFEESESELKATLQEEHPNFKELQRTVARLEMRGKEAEAVRILEKALAKSQYERRQHESYEIEMLLVEILIYKGDFGKALQCKCLDEVEISDARRPLYKAIIRVMLENPEEASSSWEQFKQIRENFSWPPDERDSQLYEVIEDFDKFEKLVKLLKHDIQETNKIKSS